MDFSQDALDARDRQGYVVLEAITHGGRHSSSTHARPHTFVCIDGKTYWVKATAQQGLVAELIAGRLAARARAGPMARIIRITPEALPETSDAGHLEGIVVGMEDVSETENARSLQAFVSSGQFQPGSVDAASRSRVVAFQTWLGVGDAQVLVGLTNGAIYSIDHGDAFGATGALNDPSVIVTAIPGVPDDVGKGRADVREAVRIIEAITDREILEAVTRIPAGEPWKSPVQRRLEIARWLGHRRGRLREVMEKWAQV